MSYISLSNLFITITHTVWNEQWMFLFAISCIFLFRRHRFLILMYRILSLTSMCVLRPRHAHIHTLHTVLYHETHKLCINLFVLCESSCEQLLLQLQVSLCLLLLWLSFLMMMIVPEVFWSSQKMTIFKPIVHILQIF